MSLNMEPEYIAEIAKWCDLDGPAEIEDAVTAFVPAEGPKRAETIAAL